MNLLFKFIVKKKIHPKRKPPDNKSHKTRSLAWCLRQTDHVIQNIYKRSVISPSVLTLEFSTYSKYSLDLK